MDSDRHTTARYFISAMKGRVSTVLAGGFFLLLAALGGGTERTWAEMPPPAAPEASRADFHPEQIKANLQKHIRERAAQEISQFDPVRDREKVAGIAKTRDQELGDVDQSLEQISQAFEKKEASENYAQASRILTEKGVAEALRFLESKSGDQDSKIAALRNSPAASPQELREVLREKLLAAVLLKKDGQLDRAEERYRAVIAADRTWAEPRNALAGLLIERGEVVEPEQGQRLFGEAVEVCRQTLALTSREQSPLDWAATQNNLGNAFTDQGENAGPSPAAPGQGRTGGGAEGQRLRSNAVAASRSAPGLHAGTVAAGLGQDAK